MKKENKGISLIVLVITIVVIIILAGAVILTLTNNNVIGTTNEAVFKSDLTSFKTELELYKSNKYLEEKGMFNAKTLFAKKTAGNVEGMEYKKIADIITNITTKGYEDKFAIFEGALMYSGDSKEEEKWCLDNGISSGKFNEQQLLTSVVKAGDYVQYIGGGYSSWRVLHTNIDGQVQIVSKTSVKDVTLGEANNITKGKSDYVNVVKILNDAAQPYINTSYADKARSLGSNPSNPRGNDTVDIGSVVLGNATTTDTNFETDTNAMNSANMRLHKVCWVASRIVHADYSNSNFTVRYLHPDGSVYAGNVYSINRGGSVYSFSSVHGFVPVVSLKSGIRISGGDGTESSPWILVAI